MSDQNLKSAIVLFVKNEISDILSWIAWHSALGFNKIYIYDDHSTDGTYELCESLKDKFNISLKQTNVLEQENFFWRQKDSYFDACADAAGHYDWIAFVDSDEYINLQHAETINEFLTQFPHANALALNWKIYGSSSRVIKDHVPVFEAFMEHSSEALSDNRLVKSIIRPEQCNYHYSDPHRFYMHDEVYVDTRGQNVSWQGSTKDIVWEGAWVNHYICRSMEHYVNRIKRRLNADLYNSIVYWDHFNKNDLRSPDNVKVLETAKEILDELRKHIIENYVHHERIKNKYGFSEKPSVGYRAFFVKSDHDQFLCTNTVDGYVCQRADVSSEKFPLVALIYDEKPDEAYVFKLSPRKFISNIIFHIKYDDRNSYCYKYLIEETSDGKIFLKNAKNQKYLSAGAPEAGALVECNRADKSDWERFLLIPTHYNLDLKTYTPACEDKHQLDALIYSDADFSYNDFMIHASSLSIVEKRKFIEKSDGVMQAII